MDRYTGKYDPEDLYSTLLHLRWEYGLSAFRDPYRMYSLLYDLAPRLQRESEILRRMSASGLLKELEQAAFGDDAGGAGRAAAKTHVWLVNNLFMAEEKAAEFQAALSAVYDIRITHHTHAPPASENDPALSKDDLPVSQSGSYSSSDQNPIPPPRSARIAALGQSGNIIWSLDRDGLLTLSGGGPMEDYFYRSGQAAVNSPWWKLRDQISSVMIADKITTIGSYAFADCENMRTVSISDSVGKIGRYAFLGCVNLQDVTIPEGVATIGQAAFAACTSLKSVAIPDSIRQLEWDAFKDCSNLKSASVPARAEIGYFVFPSFTKINRRGNA